MQNSTRSSRSIAAPEDQMINFPDNAPAITTDATINRSVMIDSHLNRSEYTQRSYSLDSDSTNVANQSSSSSTNYGAAVDAQNAPKTLDMLKAEASLSIITKPFDTKRIINFICTRSTS